MNRFMYFIEYRMAVFLRQRISHIVSSKVFTEHKYRVKVDHMLTIVIVLM